MGLLIPRDLSYRDYFIKVFWELLSLHNCAGSQLDYLWLGQMKNQNCRWTKVEDTSKDLSLKKQSVNSKKKIQKVPLHTVLQRKKPWHRKNPNSRCKIQGCAWLEVKRLWDVQEQALSALLTPEITGEIGNKVSWALLLAGEGWWILSYNKRHLTVPIKIKN